MKIFFANKNIAGLFFLLFVYTLLAWMNWGYPGIYPDSVNPDYQTALILNRHYYLTGWIMADNLFFPHGNYPILNSTYGGNINAYLAIPFFEFIGFNLFSIRFYHYILGLLVFSTFFLFLLKSEKKIASILIGFLILYFDFNYIYTWRTQYYLQIFPSVFCFGALIFFIDYIKNKKTIFKLILSSLLMGFSAYCYFIYFFISIAIFLCILIFYRKILGTKNLFYMIFFFVIGYSPFLYAHFSMIYQYGFGTYIEVIKGLQNSYNVIDPESGLNKNFSVLLDRLTLLFGGKGVWIAVEGGHYSTLLSRILYFSQVIITALSVIVVLASSIIYIKKTKKANLNSIKISEFCDNVSLSVLFSLLLFYLIIGQSLLMQHYIIIVPFLIYIIISAFEKIVSIIKIYKKMYLICIYIFMLIIAVINISNVYQMNKAIAGNGGNGYYSNVINKTADLLKKYPKGHTFMMFEWGYPLSFTTLLGPNYNIVGTYTYDDYFLNKQNYPEIVDQKDFTIIFGKQFVHGRDEDITKKLNDFLKKYNLVHVKTETVIGKNNSDKIIIVDVKSQRE